MRNWQKKVLWSAAGLVLALMLIAFAMQPLVARLPLKEIARDKVQQSWGRELVVGELTLRLLPYPQLHATHVTVSNPAWAQDPHFLEAADVTARLALLPLLTGKVVVKGLRIDGLLVNLEIAKDGSRNWQLPQKTNPSGIELNALRAQNGIISLRESGRAPQVWQLQKLLAHGDGNRKNVTFELDAMRDHHPLQLDGTLRDLSSIGQPGSVSEGTVHVKSGQAAATVSGTIPLDTALQNGDVVLTVDATSMQEAFGLLGVKWRSPAAFKGSARIRVADKRVAVSDLKLQLGKLHLSGSGQLDRNGSKPFFNARLQADRIDMIQTFLDSGRSPLPPKTKGALFRDEPLAWPLLASLQGTAGTIEAAIGLLKLRSGIEIKDVAASIKLNDDRMTVQPYSGKMLGGTVSGDAVLEGRKKAIKLDLQLNNTSLGLWFKETGKAIAISGGPMQVEAHLATSGDSMKELVADISGPINIRIGPATILSPKAGHAEYWLTGLFSEKDANQVKLACVSARLPFRSGIARGEGIVGARSDASQLLTGGMLDLRNETVDLHGRVRARSGISLGISTFAGDVKIGGKIAKPQLDMDASGVAGTLARIGAAIVTSGASIVATSIWDGANPESDPCQVVFSAKAQAAKGTPKRRSAD